MNSVLLQYVVYYSPLDYPGEYVVRRWQIFGGQVIPDKDIFMRSRSFHQIKEKLEQEMYLTFLVRDERDEKAIVGVYM